jgi:hypothetical protein
MKIFSIGKVGAAALLAALIAQSSPCMELSVGAKLGLNASGVIGDTSNAMVPRIGVNACAFASEWLTESFGLQEEIGLGFRGENWKNPDSLYPLANTYPNNFTYLEIPVLAKWKFYKHDMIRPVLYGGPDFAFPIISESVYLNGNTTDMISKTQPFDLGLCAGLSVDIKHGNAIIPIDIRYIWGATPFLKDPDYTLAMHHSVFSISAGFGWILDFVKKSEY